MTPAKRPIAVSLHQNTAAGAQQWDDFVNRSTSAALYHLHGWRDVIADTFGHSTFYLSAARQGAGTVGVLPLAQLKSRIFGNMLVSLPFFNYGGICADDDDSRAALLESAIALAREHRTDFVELREESDWNQELPKKTAKVAMRLPLPASPDDLWRSFPAKLRNQIQKPRKEGLAAVVGREDQLDAFYDVFSANMRDLGTPVYPKALFRNILRRFPERTWIVTVYREAIPVAAGFLAGFKNRMEIPWASSLRAFNRFSPNMLLYWTSLELACAKGYDTFDFGRSTPGEGTYRFKEQWGARPQGMYWYYWLPNGTAIPEVNPKNPKYRLAIAAWRRLPLALTRKIGPAIVKYIP